MFKARKLARRLLIHTHIRSLLSPIVRKKPKYYFKLETVMNIQLTKMALMFFAALLNFRQVSSGIYVPDFPFLRSFTLEHLQLKNISLLF